jgi:hypothetical protein
LTKFYDTIRVFDNENDNAKKKSVSIKALVEMAKEVSDKMILNKIKVFIIIMMLIMTNET